MSNMAILRHTLTDAGCLLSLRGNTTESFEKAVSKVVIFFSNAILQLAFEIEPDFICFSQGAPPALLATDIRAAGAEELDRLSVGIG